jgi:hypothetical protein
MLIQCRSVGKKLPWQHSILNIIAKGQQPNAFRPNKTLYITAHSSSFEKSNRRREAVHNATSAATASETDLSRRLANYYEYIKMLVSSLIESPLQLHHRVL